MAELTPARAPDDAASPIRLVIVDDDALVRSALSLMLGGGQGIEVVGEAGDGLSGVELVARVNPDVVLMDVRMPVMSGLSATRELRSLPSPPAVIVMTTFDVDEYVMSAVTAGADGFLLKDTPPAEIVAAVRRVAAGETILSPAATASLVTQLRSGTTVARATMARELCSTLTAREREVAIAVGRGLSNAEIAGKLHLSLPTVKAHVSRLLEKLRSDNRVQIALRVYDAGIDGEVDAQVPPQTS